MKAVLFHEHGGVERLRYEEVATPRPGRGEVVVRVRACGVNFFLDLVTRQTGGGWPIQLPHILGADVSGEVAQLGEGVENVAVGERVVVIPWVVCGTCSYCARGLDISCARGQHIGLHLPGGYAEYVKVPASNVLGMPERLSFEEAAAIPVTFSVAWEMIVRRGRVTGDDTVLVLGASGSVGLAALQIAKLHGARVIAVAGSDDKLERLRALGADELISSKAENLKQQILERTDGRGVDVACETVGAATLRVSLAVLRDEGRLVACGSVGGTETELELRSLYKRNVSAYFCHMGGHGALRQIVALAGEGKLRAVVDSVYPLAEAARAQQALLERNHLGKILLRP